MATLNPPSGKEPERSRKTSPPGPREEASPSADPQGEIRRPTWPGPEDGRFRLVSDFEPKGDQPEAIRKLVESIRGGRRHQVLMGVTGSGKTFTMAHLIAAVNRPTLI